MRRDNQINNLTTGQLSCIVDGRLIGTVRYINYLFYYILDRFVIKKMIFFKKKFEEQYRLFLNRETRKFFSPKTRMAYGTF